jgi:hypothetical protein
MRKLFLVIILQGMLFNVSAQDSRNKAIEKRAREFHRVIGLDDKEQWKKFITENYTQAFINKPMKAVVKTSDQSTTTSQTSVTGESVEEKSGMFQRLHQDFGSSKILSLKPRDENLEMILESTNGLKGVFNLKFDKKAPYLIDGISIEVGTINR